MPQIFHVRFHSNSLFFIDLSTVIVKIHLSRAKHLMKLFGYFLVDLLSSKVLWCFFFLLWPLYPLSLSTLPTCFNFVHRSLGVSRIYYEDKSQCMNVGTISEGLNDFFFHLGWDKINLSRCIFSWITQSVFLLILTKNSYASVSKHQKHLTLFIVFFFILNIKIFVVGVIMLLQ